MDDRVIYSTEPEDFYYMDVNVPCQAACPASTPVPAYIRGLFEGRYDHSYEINERANILPGVLGRICSRPCEDQCRHGEPELGKPVGICHVKRAASDFRNPESEDTITSVPSSGKRVAIIGSGPAGLAAAHDFRLMGITVVMYEALDEPGGMLRYGIPEFRLPRSVLKKEINAILGMGVILKTGVRIGRDPSMEHLLADYEAVLVAAGCYRPKTLSIPGEGLNKVYHGLPFMMDVCALRPPEVGRKVLVLGAGFTAFDCARTALRLGAEAVTICLRRTEEDLRVTSDEIFETKKEGVVIASLMQSRRIVGTDQVEGVEFVRTRPGPRGEDGRRTIVPIDDSRFVNPADTVIVATGQEPDPIPFSGGPDDRFPSMGPGETFRTTVPGLYASGDYRSGPSTVIEAISAGREAAAAISRDMGGKGFGEKTVRMEAVRVTDRERHWDMIPRIHMPAVLPVEERLKEMNREVETGYTPALAREEAKRCYLCHLHYEIDMSRCIYCRYCMDVAPRDCIKLVMEVKLNEVGAITGFVETTQWRDVNAILIDNARCIRCGECVRVCPVDCISVCRVELTDGGTDG